MWWLLPSPIQPPSSLFIIRFLLNTLELIPFKSLTSFTRFYMPTISSHKVLSLSIFSLKLVKCIALVLYVLALPTYHYTCAYRFSVGFCWCYCCSGLKPISTKTWMNIKLNSMHDAASHRIVMDVVCAQMRWASIACL